MTNILTGILTLIGIMGLVALIIGLPLMLLWNWLMPTLFGLPFITFWQAVGLNFLSTILFGKYTNKFNKKS
jgi:hypothetical protein